MMGKEISVTALVRNFPDNVNLADWKYIVVRRDDSYGKVELWYYGLYLQEKQAYDVALEIGNGIVLSIA